MKQIILSTANIDYLNVVKAWLMSMRLHGNNYFVRLDFINGNQEIYDKLKKVYPNMEIVHYDIPKVANPRENLLHLMWTRPPQMWKALNEDWDQICSMDCDTLVRGPLGEIWSYVKPGIIRIMSKGDRKHDRTRLQGGVYVLGNSPEIKAYYKDILDSIGPTFAFYDGQLALYTMLIKHSGKIQYVRLPEKYNDHKFKKQSMIWHAKHGKITSSKFTRYMNVCLAEANKYYE